MFRPELFNSLGYKRTITMPRRSVRSRPGPSVKLIACPGQNPLTAAFLEHALEHLQRLAADVDGDFTP